MTKFAQQFLFGFALFAVLLTQTSCVTAVMAVANAQEVADRQALKQWLASYSDEAKNCRGQITLAPIIYHDFDRDTRDELIVNAAICSGDMAHANVNLVLARAGEDSFTSLPIAELTPKQLEKAHFVGNPHYRLTTKQGLLVGTWMNDAKNPANPLKVKYQWDGHRFVVVDTKYGH